MNLDKYTIGSAGPMDGGYYLQCSECDTDFFIWPDTVRVVGAYPSVADMLTRIMAHETTDEHIDVAGESRLSSIFRNRE